MSMNIQHIHANNWNNHNLEAYNREIWVLIKHKEKKTTDVSTSWIQLKYHQRYADTKYKAKQGCKVICEKWETLASFDSPYKNPLYKPF